MIGTETYTYSLYETVSKQDQRNMTVQYRDFFNAAVEHDQFKRHGRSFIVVGKHSDQNVRATFACLMRGGYGVLYLDPVTIVRRLDNKWIPRWTDEDDAAMEAAECYIVPNLLDPDTVNNLTDSQKGDLVWFLKDAIRNGIALVLTARSQNADLDILGESFGSFMEQHVEGAQDATQFEGSSRDSRDEASGKRIVKIKRKDFTGD